MFQRQSRAPFPTRNILFLAAFILGALLFLLKNMEDKVKPESEPDPIFLDTVRVDSLQR